MSLSHSEKEELKEKIKAAGYKVRNDCEKGFILAESRDKKLKTFRAMWDILNE